MSNRDDQEEVDESQAHKLCVQMLHVSVTLSTMEKLEELTHGGHLDRREAWAFCSF